MRASVKPAARDAFYVFVDGGCGSGCGGVAAIKKNLSKTYSQGEILARQARRKSINRATRRKTDSLWGALRVKFKCRASSSADR
jgi:hypothetical protein